MANEIEYKDDGVYYNRSKIGAGIEDWQASRYYAVDDIVVNEGVFYRATSAHTSSSSFAADSARWDEFGSVNLKNGTLDGQMLYWDAPNTKWSFTTSMKIHQADGLLAFGDNATANALNTLAIGKDSTASGEDSFAVGTGSTASGDYSHAIGGWATSAGYASTAIGYASSPGPWSLSLGYQSISSGNQSTVIGSYSQAAAGSDFSVVIGNRTKTAKTHSTAIGAYTEVDGECSLGLGVFTSTGDFSRTGVIGFGINGTTGVLKNNITNSIAIGSNSSSPSIWVHGGSGAIGSVGGLSVGTSSIASNVMLNIRSKSGATGNFVEFENNAGSNLYEFSPTSFKVNYLKTSSAHSTNHKALYVNTDTGELYSQSAAPVSGNTSSRPTATNVGEFYFDTSIGKPIWWSGTNWVDATGTIV